MTKPSPHLKLRRDIMEFYQDFMRGQAGATDREVKEMVDQTVNYILGRHHRRSYINYDGSKPLWIDWLTRQALQVLLEVLQLFAESGRLPGGLGQRHQVVVRRLSAS